MSLGRKIVFIIALMVFIGAAGAIAVHYLQGAREEQAFDELTKVKKEEGFWTDKGYVIGKYAALYKKNPDLIGWLKIDDTNVNYPVMQTQNDSEFYLRKDFNKKYAVSGTPFLDAKSDIFIPTKNWLIYGHHMKNGTMFKDLFKYEEQSFYESHKRFRFDTVYKGGQAEYEVVAAFYSQIFDKNEDAFKYYNYPGITTKAELDEYVKGIMDLSIIKTDVEVKKNDQLVTMSTCSYHLPDKKKGRFAVVGKRVK